MILQLLPDRLCRIGNGVGLLWLAGVQLLLFGKTPHVTQTRTDPFARCGILKYAAQDRKTSAPRPHKDHLHRVSDNGVDPLGIVRGDIGERNSRMRYGISLPLAVKRVQSKHQVAFGVPIDLA